MVSVRQRYPEARLLLTDSASAVLRLLSRSGPMTRPGMSERLQLSKPTMSAAIGELDAHGLVAAEGISRGATGRSAISYALGPGAGFVIGVDAGTTHLRAIASTLDRRVLARMDRKLRPGKAALSSRVVGDVGKLVADMMGRLQDARVAGLPGAVALAVPAIVSPSPGRMRRQEFRLAAETLNVILQQPVLLENNVNCAALAELHSGAARDVSSFLYLQIGVKIGLGIVIDRRIHRGFNGAAGEVARMPFPWADDRLPAREGLERYLGSAALMRRCRETWTAESGAAPTTPEELFRRAREPGAARAQVERHAADIGRMVSGLVGVLDPGLVVLGGGVGRNAILLPTIASTVADLAWPTELRTSELDDDGTALGAVELAAGHRLTRLLGEPSEPACMVGEAD